MHHTGSSVTMHGSRPRAAALALAACSVLVPPVDAQDASAEVELSDATVGDGPLSFGDAVGFTAAVGRSDVDCVLTMARPFAEGMFTMVELWIDCDDDPATGLESGHELRVRAAVGSRFEPNVAAHRTAALGHLRASRTVLEDAGRGGAEWLHGGETLPDPTLDGRCLRFSFPRQLIQARAGRYKSTFEMHVVVETSCSDQPIEVRHVCGDDGIAIAVDGADDEWSDNGIYDPGDELHAAARPLDLTMLRAEHDPQQLYASVRFATAGFARALESSDVECRRSVTFRIEPQFPRYQSPAVIVVRAGSAQRSGQAGANAWRSVARDGRLEFALQRSSGQSKFRVIANSDHVCVDRFERPARLDWAKAR